jgi:hypothetical protein
MSTAQSALCTARIATKPHYKTTHTQLVVVVGVRHAMRTIPSTAKVVASPIPTTGLTTGSRIVLTASHAMSQIVTIVRTVTSTEPMVTTASVVVVAVVCDNLAVAVALSITILASLTSPLRVTPARVCI